MMIYTWFVPIGSFVYVGVCLVGWSNTNTKIHAALDPLEVVNRYDGISNICIRKFLPIILSHLKAIFGHFES